MSLHVLERRDREVVGQPHARGVVRAVAVGILVEVLLVVVLGEVELRGRRADDLGRDRAVAGRGQLAPGTSPSTPRRPRAAPRRGRRSPTGTGCPCRCPGACPGSGRGSPRRPSAAARSWSSTGSNTTRTASACPVLPEHGLLVGRVRRVAALVADRGRPHAGLLPERLLLAPEAAERELGDLEAVRVRARRSACRGRLCAGSGSVRPAGQGLGRGGDRLGLV